MNKSVIITGASDGIGKELAFAFARRGYALGLIARRRTLLEAVAIQCRNMGSPHVEIRDVDVTADPQFPTALKELDLQLNGAHYFIANAGINDSAAPEEDGSAIAERLFNVNITAAIKGCETMKSLMVSQKRKGVIVGVGSIAGIRGLPEAGLYCATKAALHAYLEGLRLDLRSYGIEVCTVAPGYILTDMTRDATHPQPFMISAEKAGEIFARDIIACKRMSIAPWQFRLIYWVLKLCPAWLYELAVSRFILATRSFETKNKSLG